MTTQRNPDNTHAWLIGSGIASLSAAVHLIREARVPPSNIHIVDVHPSTGGGIRSCGNAENGYMLYTGCLPYFHDRCVEDFLSLVPSKQDPKASLLESIKDYDVLNRPQRTAITRLVKQGHNGPQRVDAGDLQIGPRYRMELIKVMLESEKTLGAARIDEFFDEQFFKTNFWSLWSTTFALQSWHSILELRRCLRKHLGDIEDLNNVRALDRTKYTIYESIIMPVTEYLKDQGVDFHFSSRVSRLEMDPDSQQTTVAKIVIQKEKEDKEVEVDPSDIIMVTLGSPNSGSQVGSNLEAPAHFPEKSDELIDNDWALWIDLMHKSPSFGDPKHFTQNPHHTAVESFTITLKNSDFLKQYEKATGDSAGTGALLSFTDSNWGLSISVPHQPLCANQPLDVVVIWGYGLHPDETGNFVSKPMCRCSGKEIATEVFSHLGFSLDDLLPRSNTIPCLMPLGTAPLLPRGPDHRPRVIPPQTKNLAVLGQYVEIAEDTTLNMEYSVRSAQMAVYSTMGLNKSPPKTRRHLLLNVLDLLGGV
jgi:oleate hydratase